MAGQNRLDRLGFLSATALILLISGTAAAANSGTFYGTVKDKGGVPLVGAIVTVFADAAASAQPQVLKQITTDKKGRFTAANLAPGRYAIHVAAQGFTQSRLNSLEISPGAKVGYDFLLRRDNRLVDLAASDDYQYQVRAARRRTLQLNGKEGDGVDVIANANQPDPPTKADAKLVEHGILEFYTASYSNAGLSNEYPAGMNLALTHRFNRDIDALLYAQTGTDGVMQRIETATTIRVGDDHKLNVGVGYARLPNDFASRATSLDQATMRVTDSWHIKGPAILIFGFDCSRFFGPGNSSSTVVLPRLGFEFDATPTTKLMAELSPGSSNDQTRTTEFEDSQVTFTEPNPAAVSNGQVVPDRSRRMQVSVEHLLSKTSSLEATVFYDTVSGHGVGLMAIPVDATIDAAMPQVAAQNGSARGGRFVYTRRFSHTVSGAIGYSIGQGQHLSSEGLSDPAHLFQDGLFQVAVARVDVDLDTGTHISTTLRFGTNGVVFAIDPFQGRTSNFDPNVSVFVAQQLPSISFLPGRWEATVNVLNVLDQQTDIENEITRLLLGRSGRTVRGALSVRF